MTDPLPKFEEAVEARNHPDWKGEPMYGDFPDEPPKYEALDSENDRENKSPITRPKHHYCLPEPCGDGITTTIDHTAPEQRSHGLLSDEFHQPAGPFKTVQEAREYTENVNNIKCDNCTWTDPRIIDRKEIIDMISVYAEGLLTQAQAYASVEKYDAAAVVLLTYSEIERFRDEFMTWTKHAPEAPRMAEPGELL